MMKYGLIGKSLVHSYSKAIHEHLEKYEYNLFSLAPEEVKDFVSARDFGGLNVTIPYKQDVIPLCDEVSELAREIGAVNTLYIKDGKLCGHNTDYEGFLYAAKRAAIDFEDRNVLILGTGGTSLMARLAAKNKGAAKIYIASRSKKDSDDESGLITMLTYDQLPEIAESIDVIINTTPVGTYPDNLQKLITLADYPNCESVMDVIYNPFKTSLILEADARELNYSNGLPMLVAQATAAAGYFLGCPGEFEEYNEEIIKDMKSQIRNVVLIGMPGCGKTTVGKMLSNMTGKTFVDMDEEIAKRAGMTIPEIFERDGEEAFRDMESEVARDFGKERGLVISTGGGVVLRDENVDALRQNGFVIYLHRPVNKLPTNGRPLSVDLDSLRKIEKIRAPLYKDAANVKINNSKYLGKAKLEQFLREQLPML